MHACMHACICKTAPTHALAQSLCVVPAPPDHAAQKLRTCIQRHAMHGVFSNCCLPPQAHRVRTGTDIPHPTAHQYYAWLAAGCTRAHPSVRQVASQCLCALRTRLTLCEATYQTRPPQQMLPDAQLTCACCTTQHGSSIVTTRNCLWYQQPPGPRRMLPARTSNTTTPTHLLTGADTTTPLVTDTNDACITTPQATSLQRHAAQLTQLRKVIRHQRSPQPETLVLPNHHHKMPPVLTTSPVDR